MSGQLLAQDIARDTALLQVTSILSLQLASIPWCLGCGQDFGCAADRTLLLSLMKCALRHAVAAAAMLREATRHALQMPERLRVSAEMPL